MTLSTPIRNPDARSEATMTRRGWWLVVLNFLLPGSAQLIAGNRGLGRFGLRMMLLFWLIVAALVVVFLVKRTLVIEWATQAWFLAGAEAFLIVFGLLWIVLTIDTLRLVHFVRVSGGGRWGIALFTVFALVGGVGVAGYGVTLTATVRQTLGDIFTSGPSEPPVAGRYNIMLLGGDAGPGRSGMRPDSISVISIDATTGKAVNIGLPRNLDQIPFRKGSPAAQLYPSGYGTGGRCDVDVCQLNSIYTEFTIYKSALYKGHITAHSSAGIEAMRDALEGATGLTIQYFAVVDMEGFAQLVDALGGVTIDAKEKLPIADKGDANGNPITTGWIYPGVQRMDGHTAQWYARSRETTSDYDRMARQRQLENAILAQMNPANVLTKFQAVAAAGKQIITTDIPQSMLSYFVDLADKTKSVGIVSLDLVPPTVPDPSNPDWAAIHALLTSTIA
ncbi:LCP family protein, partial [Gryllotalpicola sp.]|uniref:LCP family protein n=1 Tax=Gryllotalpicola sp. TaxID=1932787 RepID=UPI002616422E